MPPDISPHEVALTDTVTGRNDPLEHRSTGSVRFDTEEVVRSLSAMLRALLATAATTDGSARPRLISHGSANHISAEEFSGVIELSGARRARLKELGRLALPGLQAG